jgi:hypothetical protein
VFALTLSVILEGDQQRLVVVRVKVQVSAADADGGGVVGQLFYFAGPWALITLLRRGSA